MKTCPPVTKYLFIEIHQCEDKTKQMRIKFCPVFPAQEAEQLYLNSPIIPWRSFTENLSSSFRNIEVALGNVFESYLKVFMRRGTCAGRWLRPESVGG
ncbi:hypothetical protein M514_09038 [Trichuris suis]|uniref:Uncharacterized protein n=1 Tax=Trichuris suis TaxID=68888 RepID=A0A085MZA7_9BILA|nr:hypothetical protein M513_09038 [Trichuris suis]KFD62553.1 hypothetical protein M514_09038 [Trichuris suis]